MYVCRGIKTFTKYTQLRNNNGKETKNTKIPNEMECKNDTNKNRTTRATGLEKER